MQTLRRRPLLRNQRNGLRLLVAATLLAAVAYSTQRPDPDRGEVVSPISAPRATAAPAKRVVKTCDVACTYVLVTEEDPEDPSDP